MGYLQGFFMGFWYAPTIKGFPRVLSLYSNEGGRTPPPITHAIIVQDLVEDSSSSSMLLVVLGLERYTCKDVNNSSKVDLIGGD